MRPQTIINGRKSGSRRQIRRLLRAANSNICQKIGFKPAAELKPGPFDASELDHGGIYNPASTLLAALLIIYPVVASVAVALAGMWFLGSAGPT